MAPTLELAFTLEVDLSPAQDFGDTHCGHRRFIPITGGTAEGPKLKATILPGGGDWNALRDDGMGHVFAKYTIQADDGTLISVTNEGWIRKFERKSGADGDDSSQGKQESEWYARTNPRFEVADGPHGWLNRTLFVGDLHRPSRPNHVTIDVYSVQRGSVEKFIWNWNFKAVSELCYLILLMIGSEHIQYVPYKAFSSVKPSILT